MSIDRHFVSDIDKFLNECEKDPKSFSDSRRAEEEKYERINRLRDHKQKTKKNSFWKNF